jgi:hypothetical protein
MTAEQDPRPAASADLDGQRLELERESAELDERRLELERERFAWEKRRGWLQQAGVVVPLAVAALSLVGIFVVQAKESQRETDAARREFMLKATELAMDSETVLGAMNRATALQAFFGDELPADYANRFQGEDTRGLDPQVADPDFGAQLISLIAAHPADCDLIVNAWLDVFTGAQWAKRVECHT